MKHNIASLLLLITCLSSRAELPVEELAQVKTLPATYPNTWVFAHDTNFFALNDAKVVLIDVASKNKHYKGQIPSAQFPSFLASSTRPELYVAETLYSRRLHGERTDFITIYDKQNLAPIDEIVIPDAKRGLIVTHKNTLQFLDNENLLLQYNFTPAASVNVIDIDKRKILAEVSIAGCTMIYPSARLSFASLCGDNTMLVSELDENGQVKKQERTRAFFNADADPLFAKPAVINHVYYFPSFKGLIQPVDMTRAEPKIKKSWSLLTGEDKAANWRPGGWQIITAHGPSRRLFVLMHADGENGTHKGGGSEVWVYDASAKERINRIVLKEWGITIEVTQGDDPYLVVINGDMEMDVYAADSGEWLRMIGGRAFETPFILHAAK